LLYVIAFPLIDPNVRAVDFAGAALFAGGLLSAGVFVAQRCGVDLFTRDETEVPSAVRASGQ
jgi:hypothetical protein